jgi:integrase
MSLYKRGKTWWVRFTAPSGERIQCSARTEDRKKAHEYHDRLKTTYWEVQKLGTKPERSWQEATVRWLKEKDYKASHGKDISILKHLDKYLGDLTLSKITRDVIDAIAEAVSERTSKSNANRYLALIRAILRRARDDWEWIDRIPKVRLYTVNSKRLNWLTHEQARALINTLPEHMKTIVRFALSTGLRRTNVTHLMWSQVDLDRCMAWIHADQSKTKKAIAVPLNDEAVNVLLEQKGKHEQWVFPYNGKPVYQVSTKAWYKSLKETGLEGFRFHDLRHTWASWHVQAGTPLNALQELGGWSSAEMVRRYAHLGANHLASYANNILEQSVPDSGTKLVQFKIVKN